MNNGSDKPPERIYLQCYKSDGSLRDFINDDVTWCMDQVNDNDAIYILVIQDGENVHHRDHVEGNQGGNNG